MTDAPPAQRASLDASAPLFFFLHVPKTGGASLRLALGQMFYPHFVYLTQNEELKKLPRNLKTWSDPRYYRNYALLGGHIARNHPVVDPKNLARPIVYMSIMRDPVRRVVSFYDFTRRRPAHPMREHTMNKTLLEAVTQPSPFRERCTQDQLRFVFGTKDEDEAERMLQRDNYILAPIEKLEEFLDAVSAASGRPRPPRVPRVNVAAESKKRGLDAAEEQPGYEEALAVIAEMNGPEIRFMERHLKDVLVTYKSAPSLVEA